MCGIAGLLNLDGVPADKALVKRMTDAIAHRGPDGEGQTIDGALGLGHRRLAIIDLSPAGRQPMATRDGRYIISYNGELYNFRELRAELEKGGHEFSSRSDTEVLLAAWAHWGPAALDRFNGMFAFAIWDRKEKSLTLARDRYGIKPLYYSLQGRTFLFGSEQKALLAHDGASHRLDLEALVEYLTFQNIFTDRTLLKGIKLFPPGHYGVLRRDGSLALKQYWDFDFNEPQRPAPDEEYREELDRLFVQAVKRQLVTDVELGAYLSGGMDSGSITAIAAKQLPYIKSFTCGFDLRSASGIELGFDERQPAEYLSYLFKTEHYEMVLKAGDMERVLPKLAWHLEEPRVGQSYPNYYVAQLASKFVKVVLAGTGGDELFGGYPWRYYRAVVNDDFEHYVDKYYVFWQRLIQNQLIREVFAPVWNEVKHVWTRDIFRDVFRKHFQDLTRPEDYINHSLYFEAKTFLHGLLIVEDKLSMAHGLETRVPFLDNDLVDFSMRVPVRLKVNSLAEVVRLNENTPGPKTSIYFNKNKDGKRLLRDVMSRHLPAEITSAEKQGFSAPDASWFKGESIDYVRRTLVDGDARIYSVLDRKVVRKLLDEHMSGTENRRLFIWSLLNLEHWMRQTIDGAPA
ncbi:MAG: asparagine synthase (glutamine-hydrolyzing) [Burkholderiales bacterium]|nr:asparagine synthase (glutamine-hydrolyzing) [Burkholderiales bacterium]